MIRSFRLDQIPGPVKSFLVKAAVLFLGWKVVYLIFLLPGRVLDKPLTYRRRQRYRGYPRIFFSRRRLQRRARHPSDHRRPRRHGTGHENPLRRYGLLNIADACNGLEVLALYAGLILCLPASPKRKLAYILVGMVGIEVLNVIRCAGLVLVYLHDPEYLNFSHHYLFTLVVYAFIFWLWYLYSRNPNIAKNLQLHASSR